MIQYVLCKLKHNINPKPTFKVIKYIVELQYRRKCKDEGDKTEEAKKSRQWSEIKWKRKKIDEREEKYDGKRETKCRIKKENKKNHI